MNKHLAEEIECRENICFLFEQSIETDFDPLSSAYIVQCYAYLKEHIRDLMILTSIYEKMSDTTRVRDSDKLAKRFLSQRKKYDSKWKSWGDYLNDMLNFLDAKSSG